MSPRYYFAAMYQRHAEMQGNAVALREALPGSTVVSRWHAEVTPGLDASFNAEFLSEHPEEAWHHGLRDIEDLSSADVIVSFTGEGARGGRHVEHGMALAYYASQEWPIRLVVVGPREHVCHCHPATERFADFESFVRHEVSGYARGRAS